MGKKVVIGMSGGVDSSVAAHLLKQQGYEVIGVTMHIWQDEELDSDNESCGGVTAVNDAKRVADQLGIPYHVMDFRNEFKENVIAYFVDEYLNARTPNPCNTCNRYVKWEALLARARELGAEYIATGHYARIKQLPNGRYTITQSITQMKDQTYALYNLTQDQLSHTIMPVGDYTKDEIRGIAESIDLNVAHKADSQDICFIPDGDYTGYLRKQTGKDIPQGNFVDLDGNILGCHKGIIHYTIGQRKGLGIALGKPAFVVDIRKETNEVVIGSNEDVFGKALIADKVNFMSIPSLEGEMRVRAKIRYSHKGADATIRMVDEDTVEVVFDEPVRAITPGQAVVFYEDDYVVGGASIIKKIY